MPWQEERWKEALGHFDKALDLGADRVEAYANAGMARLRLDRAEESIPYLERAVQRKPAEPFYHFELGNAYRALKLYDNAMEQYRLTLKYDARHHQAQNNIGVILWNLHALELAVKEFHKALAIRENVAEVHANLGNVYLVMGAYEKSISHLQRVLVLQPQNTGALNLLHAAKRLKDIDLHE